MGCNSYFSTRIVGCVASYQCGFCYFSFVFDLMISKLIFIIIVVLCILFAYYTPAIVDKTTNNLWEIEYQPFGD